MIASPSDIPDARDAVEKAVLNWNDANARSKQIILQPWRWETSAVPELGDRPQSLINAQGVDDSDIVFALFGSRLGSPTPDAVSGTVEEIERALQGGTPVHLYFSTAPLPNDVDTEQLDGLRAFKEKMSSRGLLGEFSNTSQLEHEVWKAIEHDIARVDADTPVLQSGSPKVKFRVQPREEREIRDYDSKGRPRYRTRHWVEVTNEGREDAKDVVFEPANPQQRMHVLTDGVPTVVHAGQTRTVHVEYMFGGDSEDILRIKWTEDGEARDEDFHVG